MRLGRAVAVGCLVIGIAWGCGSSGDEDGNGNNLTADAAADSSAAAAPGTGGANGGGGGEPSTGGGQNGGTPSTGGVGGSVGGGAGGGTGGSTAGAPGADGGFPDGSPGSGGTAGGGMGGGGGAGGATPPPPVDCLQTGATCSGSAGCCSKLCNPSTGLCSAGLCFQPGSPCDSPLDCCSQRCESNRCTATQCLSDNDACTSGEECCSGTCTGGSCRALNNTCRTAGNACTTSAQCCSSYCINGVCDADASWCTQTGDVCSASEQCCSGRCAIPNGASVGTCDPMASGAGCSGKSAEGEKCGGFNDCSSCCSKLCAPDPRSGVFVCQPTTGCRTEGSLCRQNGDCCGAAGSGLPGDGNVTCEKEVGADVGFCKGVACIPQGQVCKYDAADYACTSSTSDPNNCCGATGYSGRCVTGGDGVLRCNGFSPCPPGSSENDGCSPCQLDPLGIPRCNSLTTCRDPGETCSSSADCCDFLPCVPDDQGVLRCLDLPDAGPQCVAEGGTCTSSADCCSGFICIQAPGSIIGVCGNLNPPPPPPPDGGTPGTGGTPNQPDAQPPPPPPPQCAAYGQGCTVRQDCCNYDVDPNYGCFGGICKIQAG